MPSPWEHLGRTWLNTRGFASRFIRTPVGKQHYFECGAEDPARPTLVALHGLSSGATPMGPVLRKLTSHYGRIIAPDMAGHGFSDDPDSLTVDAIYEGIIPLLESALKGPAVFFGHSLGGAVSLRIAIERPDLVSGLVLLSPAGAPTPADAHEAWIERFQMIDQEAAAAFVQDLYMKSPAFLPIVAWTCRRLFRRDPVRQLLASTRRDHALTGEQLNGLTVPVRFIWGEAERTLLKVHRDFFIAHLPLHADVVTPRHFTHCPYLEYPDQVAALVAGFVAQRLAQEPLAATA
ncbi:MAG: alpha/beta fold hydrolase [Myxococcota bacterium]